MREKAISAAHARMLAGELYDAGDPALAVERLHARRLVRLYNATTEMEQPRRAQLLAELFAEIGENANIEPDFRCDYGWNIRVGDGAVVGAGSVVTHDVPPRVVAAGVPCRVLREITDDTAKARRG